MLSRLPDEKIGAGIGRKSDRLGRQFAVIQYPVRLGPYRARRVWLDSRRFERALAGNSVSVRQKESRSSNRRAWSFKHARLCSDLFRAVSWTWLSCRCITTACTRPRIALLSCARLAATTGSPRRVMPGVRHLLFSYEHCLLNISSCRGAKIDETCSCNRDLNALGVTLC